MRRTVQIIILSRAQRPHEAAKRNQSKRQGRRDKIEKNGHEITSFARLARSAFTVTMTDEPDIAAAAIKGVT